MENRQTAEIQGRPASPLDRHKAIAALELGFFSKRLSAIDDPSLRFLSLDVIKVDLSRLSDEIPTNHFVRLHQLLDELERLRNAVGADPKLLRSLTELYVGEPIDAIPYPALRWQEVPSEINELADCALAVGAGLWVCYRTGRDIGDLVRGVEMIRRLGPGQRHRYSEQVWERVVVNIRVLVQGGLRTDPWLRDFSSPAIEIEKLIKSSSLAPPVLSERVGFREPCPVTNYPFPNVATDEKTLYEFIMWRLWVALQLSDCYLDAGIVNLPRLGWDDIVPDMAEGAEGMAGAADKGVKPPAIDVGADAAGAKPRQPDKPKLQVPDDKMFAAYRLKVVVGVKTQKEIAEMLSKEYRKKIHQGTVSVWLDRAEKWITAGNVMPNLPGLAGEPQSVDPKIINMGARLDGHVPRQRVKRKEEEDDE